MHEFLLDMFTALSPILWLVIAMAIVVVAFTICIAIALFTGDVNKFKKAANIFLSDPSEDTAQEAVKAMPVAVQALHRRVNSKGEYPSETLRLNSVLHVPFLVSSVPKLPFILFFVTVLAAVLAAAGGAFIYVEYVGQYMPTSASFLLLGSAFFVLLVGVVLVIVLQVIIGLIYGGVVKAFAEYVHTLENLNNPNAGLGDDDDSYAGSHAGGYDESTTDTPVYSAQSFVPTPIASRGGNGALSMATIPPTTDTQGYGATSFTHAAQNPEPLGETIAPIAMDVYEEPVSAYAATPAPPPPGIAPPSRFTARAPVGESAAQGYHPRAQYATPPPPPQARSGAPLAMSKTPQTSDAPRTPRPPAAGQGGGRPQRTQGAQQPRPRSPVNDMGEHPIGGTAEELVGKINRAIAAEAPLAALKELALKLQQERAKPDNKTADKQKLLSEAQIRLMKAMTNAMRK